MKQYQNITVTLLMAAALIIVLSFFIPKNKEKYLRDMFWTQKTFAPNQYDVVLMGDSRTYRGLSPSVMEKALPGLKVLNFGYSNGGLNKVMFKAAQKKLSPNNANKVIVIGVSPNCITGYSQKNEQYLQEKRRPKEDIFERLYLNKALYYFSPVSPEALKEMLTQQPSATYYNNEYFSNGYVLSEKFPADTTEAIPSYISDYTNFKVEEQFIDVLTAQVEEWNSKGIKVIGFRPPTTFAMRAVEDTLGHYNEPMIKEKFCKAGGHWVDLYPGDFKTYDGSHLEKNSAVLLSEIVSKEIAKVLGNEISTKAKDLGLKSESATVFN
ncbi:MAG: hypothetical protein ACM3O8_06570 [Methylococcaceae bacterium]